MAEETKSVEVETTQQAKGKLVMSVTLPSPMWATWVFRIQFFANKAIMVFLSGTNTISPDHIKQYILILTCIDVFVWGLAKSLGIKPPETND